MATPDCCADAKALNRRLHRRCQQAEAALEKDLDIKMQSQAAQLRRKDEVLHRKNLQLDALHFVWCNGGCEGGTHRFTEGDITVEIVEEAERNTRRLRKWWLNRQYRQEHQKPTEAE